MRSAIAVCLLLLGMTGCEARPKDWTAYVLPDPDRPQGSVLVRGMQTLPACRRAAIDVMVRLGGSDVGIYECGYDCHYSKRYRTLICKEMRT